MIRDATLEDVEHIVVLLEELGYPTPVEEMTERMQMLGRDSSYRAMVAVYEGKVVGMIGLAKTYFYEKRGLYIRIITLITKSEHRNLGIGAALVKRAEDWARELGATGMTVSSNKRRSDAHRFYHRLGYEDTSYTFFKRFESAPSD
ncbi:MAG: hypothetical protein A2201_05645 [Alicyclobacillus sp. RIFOXYA1_FULL_53_8]|nr:MAG: hypothetical protein A2201_05645 [Alicyclobacillus sp. RIFOXYA1_FULL_53_8]